MEKILTLGKIEGKKRRDTDTPGEPHLITEAEIGVMLPRVKECLGILKAERDKERIFPRSLRENIALPKPSFWGALKSL